MIPRREVSNGTGIRFAHPLFSADDSPEGRSIQDKQSIDIRLMRTDSMRNFWY